jgi:hypothetical protein
MDPLTDFDWAEHWRALVEARDAQVGGRRPPDFWDRRARAYSFSLAGQHDPLFEVMEPYLDPHRTLIDVGAGSGRHSGPLAGRLDWVTAVEPSEGMRRLIPPADNMTVIAASWQDADVAAADLVLSAHVLYPIADVVPFIEKMQACARERVFICLRDAQLRHPAEKLWEVLAGQPRARAPQFYDLYNLLHWMGIDADVVTFRHPVRLRFEALELALDDSRTRVGEVWDEDFGRRWLSENLQPDDGGLVYEGGEITTGVAHWKPRN